MDQKELNNPSMGELKMTGRVKIEMFREDGTYECDEFDNLVVTAGKNHMATKLASTATSMGWIEVGTGTTAAAAGDTTLEAALYREACSVTPTNNTVAYSTTLAAGEGTGAITEAGIFNASSAGTMLARTVFAVKNKGASDVMTLTWTITIN